MWHKITTTTATPVALVLRITLALIMLPHGLQLLLGWFGGAGFKATMAMFTQYMHLPWIVALGSILITSLGSFALLVGFWGRIMAFLEGLFLLGALLSVHLSYGFFMNWSGKNGGEGFEYHLLGIGIAIALVILGSGSFSADLALQRKQQIDGTSFFHK
jgi:putative oxidoreductase